MVTRTLISNVIRLLFAIKLDIKALSAHSYEKFALGEPLFSRKYDEVEVRVAQGG